MLNHVAAGETLAPAKYRNFPNRILRAFDNAKHIDGLSRSVRDTLGEICRFIKQSDPFETVFPHRATIANRIGSSERTVYRHLQILVDLALIEVIEQERRGHNGRFGVARIRLTRKAAILLGLIVDPNAVVHSQPSDILADGHTLTEPTISKSQLSQRTENGVPKDLSWLTGNGLKREGIFKLMGLAKQHGKRLSDIVIVVHQYIRDIKGARLFAYLRKLAIGPTDFSLPAANERKRIADELLAEAQRQKARIFRERFKRTALVSRDQSKLYLIDDTVRFAQVFTSKMTGTVPMNDLSQWIEWVETGALVFATLEVERKFTKH